jgi:hypothetical protein
MRTPGAGPWTTRPRLQRRTNQNAAEYVTRRGNPASRRKGAHALLVTRPLAYVLAAVVIAGCGRSTTGAPIGDSSGAGGRTGAAGAGSGGTNAGGSTGSGGKSGFAGMSGETGGSRGGSAGSNIGGGASGSAASTGGAIGGAGGSAAGGSAGAADAGLSDAADGGQDLYPLMKVLPLFTAANVPARGPMESPPSAKSWTSPATLPTRIGNGIAQHPMLYVGENYNRISLVNGGKVIWTYDTAPGYELDDVWMLSNGHILYSHLKFIEELTPDKQVVWHYAPTSPDEIHSCQPIGLDRVLFFENSPPPMGRIRIYNKTTKTFEVDHALAVPTDNLHGELRRIRMTAAGTYLAAYLDGGKVIEYDKDFNVVWTYTTARPWSAVRLKNGNTLIQDESLGMTKEVNPAMQIVWQLAKTDLTLPAGTMMGNTQSCERLSNGDTVMLADVYGISSANYVNSIQAVEVTPAKQIVWILQDWIHLGDATSAQFLDEPGYPEVPGGTNH